MCGPPAQGTYPTIPDTRVQAEAVVWRSADKQGPLAGHWACSRPATTHSLNCRAGIMQSVSVRVPLRKDTSKPAAQFGNCFQRCKHVFFLRSCKSLLNYAPRQILNTEVKVLFRCLIFVNCWNITNSNLSIILRNSAKSSTSLLCFLI